VGGSKAKKERKRGVAVGKKVGDARVTLGID